jgi:hypothetical protein
MRGVLYRHAKEIVDCPTERKAADKAYATALPLLNAAVEERYPPKDMVILKKYEAANNYTTLKVSLSTGGFTQITMREGDGMLMPCWHGALAADAKMTKAIDGWLTAEDTLKKAVEKKLADYNALIQAASTFQEVVEVWPEAEAMRTRCGASAVVIAVTPEVVARIRADVAARKKAA